MVDHGPASGHETSLGLQPSRRERSPRPAQDALSVAGHARHAMHHARPASRSGPWPRDRRLRRRSPGRSRGCPTPRPLRGGAIARRDGCGPQWTGVLAVPLLARSPALSAAACHVDHPMLRWLCCFSGLHRSSAPKAPLDDLPMRFSARPCVPVGGWGRRSGCGVLPWRPCGGGRPLRGKAGRRQVAGRSRRGGALGAVRPVLPTRPSLPSVARRRPRQQVRAVGVHAGWELGVEQQLPDGSNSEK